MTEITSTKNEKVKRVASLRERRGRRKLGRIVIDGLREIGRALAAGMLVEEAFFLADSHASLPDLLDELDRLGAVLHPVAPHVFEKLAFGNRHEGIVVVAQPPERGLDDIRLIPQPLIGVVEGVEKPGNLGAIVRTAAAAGLDAIVSADARTDLFNPNAIRASLGCIFSLPVVAASCEQTLRWLTDLGIPIFAARVDGATPYSSVSYESGAAIVLGSEADGLSAKWQAEGIINICLPMTDLVDSLNVSATAAVLFYEAARHRHQALDHPPRPS